jgi:hypothetical protein
LRVARIVSAPSSFVCYRKVAGSRLLAPPIENRFNRAGNCDEDARAAAKLAVEKQVGAQRAASRKQVFD